MVRTAAWVALLALSARCQDSSDEILVLTRLTGQPASALLIANWVTGSVTPVGRFAGDGLPPLAVASDPVNEDALVAIADPLGSRLRRLRLDGASVTRERDLGTVPGVVSGIGVGPYADLWVATSGANGGLFTLPRNGGTVVRVLSLPNVVAIDLAPGSDRAWLAQTDTGTGGALYEIDLPSGTIRRVVPLPALAGQTLTSVIDPMVGADRVDVATTSGALYRIESSTPVLWNLQSAFGAGGAMRLTRVPGYLHVLGGASAPAVSAVPLFANYVFPQVASLPGDPVAMVERPLATGYRVTRFGHGTGSETIHVYRIAHNAGERFWFQVVGGWSSPSYYIFGTSDQSWSGQPLPLTTVFGSQLFVSVDGILYTTIASFSHFYGSATSGMTVFVQAAHSTPTGLVFTDALAIRLSP
jgi:hypothetical protein